jgi:hypothetical protein
VNEENKRERKKEGTDKNAHIAAPVQLKVMTISLPISLRMKQD